MYLVEESRRSSSSYLALSSCQVYVKFLELLHQILCVRSLFQFLDHYSIISRCEHIVHVQISISRTHWTLSAHVYALIRVSLVTSKLSDWKFNFSYTHFLHLLHVVKALLQHMCWIHLCPYRERIV